MFVPKIGITGHRPQGFSNQSYVQDLCEQTVGYCMENFHNSEFNIGGCRGADSWVAKACIKHNCPFHLYLPFPVDIQAAAWSVEEREDLKCQTLDAKSVDVTSDRYGTRFYHIRDRKIVDNSHLLICFWEGKRSGGTYNTLKYALSMGKPVWNALNELQEVSL